MPTTTKQEKIDVIRNIATEEDIHILLEEILPELGFSDVYITHERGNKSENGKDLICSINDSIEDRKDWIAFVVKKGVVAGKSQVIQDIIAQTKDCFEYEYTNVVKGLRFRVNKVKIVTNRHFSAEAKSKIENNNYFDKSNIAFWDEEKLYELIETHYPQFWLKGGKAYKKYVELFSERIKVENMSKTLGINSKKVEKIISCSIQPRVTERKRNDDDTFTWKEVTANSVVNLSHNTIIVGDPGSGKTTLFKQFSKEIIEQNSLRNNVEFYPIILNFQDLKNASFNLEGAVYEYFRQEWNKDLNIDAGKILNERTCALFVDALDELAQPDLKEQALKSIRIFYSKYPEIKIVCSTRPSDYVFLNCHELGFKYLNIDHLNRKQVEGFLNNYFSDNINKSKKLLKSLQDTGILEKLPKTPMTLALITILFDEKEIEIPATITDLYRQFVDLLLGRYTPESTVELIEIGIKHRLLCFIAKSLHFRMKQSVTKKELYDLLVEYSKERGQSFDIDAFVEDIIENSGLLFKNEKQEIQFKHLSFQEYFTAYEIFHHRPSENKIFIENFNNLWWQNVAIFYAGYSKDAPTLLQEILDKSLPKNIEERVANTFGMGKLLQALYNTPMDKRLAGVERGVDNISASLKFLFETEDKRFDILKNFSKYSLLQIFGAIFQFSYWSVTLVEPLKQQFHTLIQDIDKNRSEEEQFFLEYKLYLMTSILASDQFISFQEFRELVEKSKSGDLSLFAILATHAHILEKHLSEENKKDEDFKKADKKIKKMALKLGSIADEVNVPLKKLPPKNTPNA